MRRTKHDTETILNAVKDYLTGNSSKEAIAKRLGVNRYNVDQWIANYQSIGESAFLANGNQHYSKELKEQAVGDYLSGKGSLLEVCKRYKIKSTRQLRNWIKKYNGHEELKASGTGGETIMTKGRKTSFDERVEIVQYCIAHDHNYAETATKYEVCIDAIRTAVWELEKAGYIRRSQSRDTNGKMAEMIYTIYEQPVLENPTSVKPVLENPTSDDPVSENPTQLNKEKQITDPKNKDGSNTDSDPFRAPVPSPAKEAAAEPPEGKRMEPNDAYKRNLPHSIWNRRRMYDRDHTAVAPAEPPRQCPCEAGVLQL